MPNRRWTTATACAVVVLAILTSGTGPCAAEPVPPEDNEKFESADDSVTEEIARLKLLVEELERQRQRDAEEIRRLRERLDALESRSATETNRTEEVEELIAEAERLAGEEPPPAAEAPPAVGRERTLQDLNPEISFLGDFSYDWSDTDVRDQFLVRGIEIGFQAPLDPHTRFKAFLAAHEEPPELELHDDAEPEGDTQEHDGLNVAVEEAYMEWVALPFHTRLRVGKFRQQFGTINRWHPHAFPSVEIPFALRNLFGHDGLVGVGVGFDWLMPRLWASSNSLTLEVVNADNASAFAGSDFNDPAFLLRHTGFFDLGPDAYFEVGLNGMTGPNDETGSRDTRILGIDVNALWEPVRWAKYRGVEFRAEYFRSRFEGETEVYTTDSWYAYLTAKLGRRWSVGVRYDDAELPSPRVELPDGVEYSTGLHERAVTPFLTFWQSEFVRLRLQYQHASRDVAWTHGPDDDDRVWLQVTFAAGPHKHESY